MTLIVREAELPADRMVLLRFIGELNKFESQFESNRRLDPAFPAEFLSELVDRAAIMHGKILVAVSQDDAPCGWAVCWVEQHESFVDPKRRAFGHVFELYVDVALRGQHIGRDLLSACENHFRSLNIESMTISALCSNTRAVNAYRSAGFHDYSINFRKYL